MWATLFELSFGIKYDVRNYLWCYLVGIKYGVNFNLGDTHWCKLQYWNKALVLTKILVITLDVNYNIINKLWCKQTTACGLNGGVNYNIRKKNYSIKWHSQILAAWHFSSNLDFVPWIGEKLYVGAEFQQFSSISGSLENSQKFIPKSSSSPIQETRS